MGLEGGVWSLRGREYVWFMPVTPAQGWVHSKYSVDGELRKEQIEGGAGMLELVSHSLWLPGESGVTRVNRAAVEWALRAT